MPANKDLCIKISKLLVNECGIIKARRLVERIRALPIHNKSVKITLERIYVVLQVKEYNADSTKT